MSATRQRVTEPGKMLRVYVGSDDQWQGRPLHECIVEWLRDSGFAGATVHRGMVGYGAHHRLRPTGFLRLSHDEPVIITVVDLEDKIKTLLPVLDVMVTEGLVTIGDVDLTMYRRGHE